MTFGSPIFVGSSYVSDLQCCRIIVFPFGRQTGSLVARSRSERKDLPTGRPWHRHCLTVDGRRPGYATMSSRSRPMASIFSFPKRCHNRSWHHHADPRQWAAGSSPLDGERANEPTARDLAGWTLARTSDQMNQAYIEIDVRPFPAVDAGTMGKSPPAAGLARCGRAMARSSSTYRRIQFTYVRRVEHTVTWTASGAGPSYWRPPRRILSIRGNE